VSDIFNEVDEEVRREKIKQLWERYSGLIIGVALLIVLSVAGWRGYDWWETRRAAEWGASFEAAAALAEAGNHAEAATAFQKIAAEGTAGYRLLAGFRAAAELAPADPQAAVKAYDALAADASIGRTMQDLAAVRAGLLLVDTAPLAELTTRLEALTGADRAFRHTARELLMLAAWRAGDQAAIKRWVDLIGSDAETPAGTRSRMDVLMTVSPASKG
jgi:hypothetical protein